MKTARDIIQTAADLVGGDREKTHGNKTQNHANIARIMSAYLKNEGIISPHHPGLGAKQAAMLVACLKIARTSLGSHNIDDYVDLAGYAGVAGEIAESDEQWVSPPRDPTLYGCSFGVQDSDALEESMVEASINSPQK